MDKYNGWKIITFRWKGKDHYSASQFGVTMNTNSLDGIKSMIDTKIWEGRKRKAGEL